VLDGHAVDFEDLDPVASARLTIAPIRSGVLAGGGRITRRRPWLRAVDDDAISVHPAHVDVRRRDRHPRARLVALHAAPVGIVVVRAGPDENPIPRSCGADRMLDAGELARTPSPRPHPQDARTRGRYG